MLADETGLKGIIDPWMHLISSCIEAAGVGIMVCGAVVATLAFLYAGIVTTGWPGAFRRYRANLGRAILLGLELLVAADIIAEGHGSLRWDGSDVEAGPGTAAASCSCRAWRCWTRCSAPRTA